MTDEVGGVRTSNKFAFLDEDGPPVKPKKAPVEKKENKAPATKKTTDKAPRENKPREGGDRGDRGGRGGGRGGGARGRGGGRGRGRGGGGRGGGTREGGSREGGREGGGKREFDRHVSGTGRRDKEKRGGNGQYNWGAEGEGSEDRPRRDNRRNNRREAEEPEAAQPETETPATEEKTEQAAGEEATKENAAPENAEPEEDPEPATLTYDEHLELLKQKRLEEDLAVKVREVDNNFEGAKAAVAFKPKEDDNDGPEYIIGGAASKKGKKRQPNKKGIMNIDEFMKDAESSGRGGYSRGRGRGSNRGRGGRGGRINMDESNFPKLG